MTVEQIIKENKGTIIDVRTVGEYQGGHVAGSKNIPLQELPGRLDELKKMDQPFVMCCASGNRSGQATGYLKQLGYDCHNGGSWMDVNFYQSQCISN